VDEATDGTQAVEAHTWRPYHLILMNSQMPVMHGFEGTRCIRQLAFFSDRPHVTVRICFHSFSFLPIGTASGVKPRALADCTLQF
jgi:CheY-like chemotaxis protein